MAMPMQPQVVVEVNKTKVAANTTTAHTKKRKLPLDNGYGLWFFCFSSGQLLPVFSAVIVKLRPLIAIAAKIVCIIEMESAAVD